MTSEQPDEPALAEDESKATPVRSWRRRLVRATTVTLAGLAALLVAAALLLDTSPGRRVVAEGIQAIEFENGMRIGIGRIEGSLYGAMVVHDLSLKDPQGEFLFSPQVELDWRPFAFIGNRLDIRSASAERMMLRRLPRFRDTPPSDEPLLPDFDIKIGSLEIVRFDIDAAVTGERRLATLSGEAEITDGRAQIHFAARTLAVEGGAEGDRFVIDLDAVPETNRLSLEADIDAPAGGVIAAITGLAAPLAIDIHGSGDWTAWDGTLTAASGNANVARLKLGARDGSFALKGPALLAPVTSGVFARLFASEAQFDLSARLEDGAVALNGDVSSKTFSLDAGGTVDFSENRFEHLALDLDVSDPSVFGAGFGGSEVSAMLTFDGELNSPSIRYLLAAPHLTYDRIGLQRFRTEGVATVEDGRVHLPVAARAQRITGLDREAGDALTDVRLDGDVTIDGARLLGENIRIRSDRIDAKGVMIADLDGGRWSGTLNGRIGDYRLESVAILTIEADADLAAGEKRGFGLTGRVRARSTSLLSGGVRQLFGGNFAAAGDVRYAGGTVSLDRLQLKSPYLDVTEGHGVITAGGRTTFAADATSDRYGRIALSLTGTLANPDARITAEHPGLGIGLTDLEARITGIDNGLRFAVTAGTDYGPLTADVGLETRGPLELRINRAELSGVRFSGGMQQSAEGPFSGTLRANGNGLAGVVTLGPDGAKQAADFKLRSTGSAFRGPAGLTIGSAIVDGRAVLEDRPRIVADAQLGGLHARGLNVAAARVRIDYRDGRGQAKALLESGGAVPFRLAANAKLEPGIWRVALKGKVRGIDVSTASPARIHPGDGSYELLPANIAVGSGKLRLSGSYGNVTRLRAQLDSIDLALVNAFIPDLGVGGTASGSFDFVQEGTAALPRANARLRITRFTRATAHAVSQPVDVSLSGNLADERGEVEAVMRTNGGVAGRLQAFLKPALGQSASWQQRLRNAELGGGVRYSGSADTLLSLAGQPNQRLFGPITVAADFSCRLDDPCLEGVVRGTGLRYEDRKLGTHISGIEIDGRFDGSRLMIEKLAGKAGAGTVDAKGQIGLSSSQGFPADLALSFDNAELARSEAATASATGQLRLTKVAGQRALLSGTLRLPETRYRLVREGAAQVARLSGVRFLPPKGRRRITGDELPMAVAGLFDEVVLDIDIAAPDRLYVTGMGLESEWSARFKLLGTPENPRLDGGFALQRGTFGFAGRSFKLTKGSIRFSGSEEIDPELSLTGTDNFDELAVTANIEGRASDPRISFSSVPGLPEDEILSRILFGRSIANLGPLQAVQLAASLNALRGSGKGLNPLGKLRSVAGIDRLRIVAGDEATGNGTAIAAGQHITDNIYVELITDARGFTATQLEVSLKPWLSVLSEAGGAGGNNVNLRIKKDY